MIDHAYKEWLGTPTRPLVTLKRAIKLAIAQNLPITLHEYDMTTDAATLNGKPWIRGFVARKAGSPAASFIMSKAMRVAQSARSLLAVGSLGRSHHLLARGGSSSSNTSHHTTRPHPSSRMGRITESKPTAADASAEGAGDVGADAAGAGAPRVRPSQVTRFSVRRSRWLSARHTVPDLALTLVCNVSGTVRSVANGHYWSRQ